MQLDSLPNNLLIFDGVCKFCNASVNFIIRHDANTVFYFATLQSNTGNEVLTHFGLDPNNPSTLVLVRNGQAYTKSNATLAIAQNLQPPWSYLGVLSILPGSLRDAIYTLIANNRYRIMGKRERCMVPSEELKARFLD